MKKKTRLIAFYLPQYHPIPENDEWWGKGFTEWTNVAKAKPLFRGHEQPKIPKDLGFYDLRVPETRQAQAELAREAGIEGFCYWHYWFGNNKRLLERPFNEVLSTGKPDLPFCLGWANHSWEKKTWQPGKNNKLLIKQNYDGIDDYTAHFYSVLTAFKDERYIRIKNMPIFIIWSPENLPNASAFISLWNNLAKQNGLRGVHFIAFCETPRTMNKFINSDFSAITLDLMQECSRNRKITKKFFNRINRWLFNMPRLIDYQDYVTYFLSNFPTNKKVIPCIYPNYDHTPRSGKLGIVLKESTPTRFGNLLKKVTELIENDEKIVFIKSWNEWGEGNYLEPDFKYNKQYLEIIKKVINN